ncbi:MAG TPA: FtsX-like permease family protein [Steroidobacteraceae bacterium]
MKYLPLVWSGIWRKPGRTALVLLQVAVAFALFGVLQGMKTGVDNAVAKARADVLFIGPAVFGGAPLPHSSLDRLRTIPGVKTVSFADGLLGTYQKPNQFVFALAIDPGDEWMTLVPELVTFPPHSLEALRKTRTGVLITTDLGKKYGWHVGDRIPMNSALKQKDGSGTWTFDVVGYLTDRELGQDNLMVMNYSYLDEARLLNKGTVRNLYAIVDDPRHAAEVSAAIDRVFANSSNETQTASFRELSQQQMRQIGDLNFAIRSIVGAVLVALLFSTATMMMQTIRERTAEFAVLKTLGFTDRGVFLTIVAEALCVCTAGALVGLALAWGIFPYAAKFVAGLSMPLIVIAIGVAGAVCIAVLSAVVPAFRAARIPVADALAGR